MKTKFIFVTGGVVSSLGKGIVAASLACLFRHRACTVTMQKLDPYLNVDPGTMNPNQHGEVFVTDDGAETDLDLGHYERFLEDVNLTKDANVTSGKIYQTIIEKERRGDYLGKTVQVIPHVTDEIKSRIYANAEGYEIAIVEIGGTIGDIEAMPFLEAVRQIRNEQGANNVAFVHTVLLPYIAAAGELKTKPAQHSVKELRGIGIQPDFLVCRMGNSDKLTKEICMKLAMSCDVKHVIANPDAESIYKVPLNLIGFEKLVAEHLNIKLKTLDIDDWSVLYENIVASNYKATAVKIVIVGKYNETPDAYISIVEALKHAGYREHIGVQIEIVNAEVIEDIPDILEGAAGILIPGGFGTRGVEGKIAAARYAREHGIPFFGICLGMQCAVIEFARNVCGMTDAHSTEFFKDTTHPVVDLMESQVNIKYKGGTMRLGSYPCSLLERTWAFSAYWKDVIHERHRHRYEVNYNSELTRKMVESGLIISGVSPDNRLVEIVELDKNNHPWYVGCQFHPEFKSRPNQPHPLFRSFVRAANRRGGANER